MKRTLSFERMKDERKEIQILVREGYDPIQRNIPKGGEYFNKVYGDVK